MEFYTAAGVYINCKLYPFITWILCGWKLYETRTRRVLHPLIGQRVFLIETGHGRPLIIGSAKITEAEQVPYTDVSKRRQAQITGTTYDIKPGSAKWFYKLEDVEWLPEPIPAPDTRKNHGRSYCTWDAYRTREI
jgi:hypothetical protein